MKRALLFSALLCSFCLPALAAQRTLTLAVPGMSCSVCPITVNKALREVPGVISAKADLDAKEAVVTYDDAKTSPDRLIKATTDAGYPSTVKAGPK
jgi:mercuric ion binding protein